MIPYPRKIIDEISELEVTNPLWEAFVAGVNSVTSNHKGQWCFLRENTLCQEGYCANCCIYLDTLKGEL